MLILPALLVDRHSGAWTNCDDFLVYINRHGENIKSDDFFAAKFVSSAV